MHSVVDLQLTRPAPPLHRSGSRSCGSPGVLILTNAKGSIGWAGTPGGVCNNRHPSRPNPSGSTSTITITIGISSVLVCSVGCEKGSKWDNTSAPLVGWPGTPNPAKLWTNTAAANIHSRPSGSFQKGPQKSLLTTRLVTHPLSSPLIHYTLTYIHNSFIPSSHPHSHSHLEPLGPHHSRQLLWHFSQQQQQQQQTNNPHTTALATLPTETKSPPGGDCTSSTVSKERVFGLCLPHSCADSPPNGLDHQRQWHVGLSQPASPYSKG
ncbi:hypothetical protein NEUTE2DRAFT_115151 [Neurospora tetrasperma FGSC 2509]|nr:hypothetical protein NEUTE2DRAFT_115151 [Neurospora tetrasperma FGSC 2509]